jgi:type I restriction enzyme R subunit
VDDLIEYFRYKERRKEFFKEYKEIEMLYEIISPDAFLRPFIDDYSTLSAMYAIVRKAYAKRLYIDRAFQKKTNELVQSHVSTDYIQPVSSVFEINEDTVKYITGKKGGNTTKIINLVKSIEKTAEEQSDDPYLIAMAERAKAVQENFEERQINTQEALNKLLDEIEKNEKRKKEQAEKGFDGLTFFVYQTLVDAGIKEAEKVSENIRTAFAEHPNWQTSEAELRELRNEVTFAVYAAMDNLDEVAQIVDELFKFLKKPAKSYEHSGN